LQHPAGCSRHDIHDFDLARFFLGEIVEVYATGANVVADYIAELGDIDSAAVVMRGGDGELCQIMNSRRSVFGYDQRLEAFGATGMLSVGNQHRTSVRLSNATQTEAAPNTSTSSSTAIPCLPRRARPLITAMEQGDQPSPGFSDGREALALAMQLSRASRPAARYGFRSGFARKKIPMSKDLLAGKIILVNGGNRGLGAGIARAAADAGAAGIMITGRDRVAGEALAAELDHNGTDQGSTLLILPIRRQPPVLLLLPWTATVGLIASSTPRVSLRVERCWTPPSNSSTLTSPSTCGHRSSSCRPPRTDMRRRQESGSIVNIISFPHTGAAVLGSYVSAKAGLVGLTRNAAYAHRFDRIRINGLNIGWTETEVKIPLNAPFTVQPTTGLLPPRPSCPWASWARSLRSPSSLYSCSPTGAEWSPAL
jgi:NAD(P)-dependent dehydrogenase (short-subunit alcohol dehydrogenase family)